jgi:hypothetical protein
LSEQKVSENLQLQLEFKNWSIDSEKIRKERLEKSKQVEKELVKMAEQFKYKKVFSI